MATAAAVLGFLLLLPLAGMIYQAIGARRDRRRYPPPGRIVNGLHVHEQGQANGAPVLLEAGIGASSISWRPVAARVAEFARVLSYDRPGLGWSERGHAPLTLDNLLAGLESLLPPGRAVLAGHSFGGYLLRHFAARYPQRVAALVLVDPMEPAEFDLLAPVPAARLQRGITLARRGALLARCGVVRLALSLALAGSRRLPQLISRLSAGNGAAFNNRMAGEIAKLPREVWPIVAAHWMLPASFLAIAEYLERLPAACRTRPDDGALADIPLWVISGAHLQPAEAEAHRQLAACSKRGRHVTASGSGHWVLLDEPDLVAEAIRAAVAGRLD